MKLKKIFEKLSEENIVSKYSIFKDSFGEFIIIHLNSFSKLKLEYNENYKNNIKFTNIKNKIDSLALKKFLLSFYSITEKIEINNNDYLEFFWYLTYEKKLNLLWISREQAERVFVKWTIDIHPKLKKFAYKKWYIHISVMSLSLKRPIIFRSFSNIEFPYDFVIKWIDIITPWVYEERFNDEFYLDSWYGKNSNDVYENRWFVLGWEARWKSWKPTPIKHWEHVNLTIHKFWTPELYDWWLIHDKKDFFSCWIDLHNDFKNKFNNLNKLVVEINTTNTNNKKELVAKKEFENLDLNNIPIAVSFNENDIIDKKKYIKNNKIVTWYINAYLTIFDNNKIIKTVISWWRASVATIINISWLYWLKVILYTEKTKK